MSPSWQSASASVRGAAHDRKGLPNQDAVAVLEVGASVVAAVSDGHGGSRYVRSMAGAEMAVQLAVQCSRAALESGQSLSEVVAQVPATVVSHWREKVLAHHAVNPFTAEERTRSGVELHIDPIVAYGATLLIAVLTDDGVGLMQLGDGDVVVSANGTGVTTPIPSDSRLVGGATTSLCLPDADLDFRRATIAASDDPQLILLATDGYGNSFADPQWRTQVCGDLRDQLARDGGIGRVQEQLPAWLNDSAVAAGDDVTVVVLHRTEATNPRPSVDVTPIPSGSTLLASGDVASGVDSLPTTPPPSGPQSNGTTPFDLRMSDQPHLSAATPSPTGVRRRRIVLAVGATLLVAAAAVGLAGRLGRTSKLSPPVSRPSATAMPAASVTTGPNPPTVVAAPSTSFVSLTPLRTTLR